MNCPRKENTKTANNIGERVHHKKTNSKFKKSNFKRFSIENFMGCN